MGELNEKGTGDWELEFGNLTTSMAGIRRDRRCGEKHRRFRFAILGRRHTTYDITHCKLFLPLFTIIL